MAPSKQLKHKQWLLQNNSNTSNGYFKTTQTQVMATLKQLKHK